jgi:hypothetical protein
VNDKLRIGLSVLFALIIIVFKYSNSADILSTIILLTILIFDIIKYSRIENTKSVLIYYLSWILISGCVIYIRNVGLNFWSPLILILTIKTAVLFLSYFRYKKLYVTKTILGYLWLISLFLYISELILNSTHGFGKLCLNLAVISSIESILIVIFHKKQVIYKPSIINICWNKIKNYLQQQLK